MIPIVIPIPSHTPVACGAYPPAPHLTVEQLAGLQNGQYYIKIYRMVGVPFPWKADLHQYPDSRLVDHTCASTKWGIRRAVKGLIAKWTKPATTAEVIPL